jgi:hypothetical protein
MKKAIGLLIISALPWIVFPGHCLSPAKAAEEGYVWPIEGRRDLSSTFAEYRSFRFHSGIDIPTQKRTGYKVLACQSGYVYRLFTSWGGYGKAVYLRLDDGRFAVYGHLRGFSEEISEVVVRKQLQARKYGTDLLLPANQIRVNRGELIGYSGESGWGGPHLHFELRDSTGHPLNPLTFGFPLEDQLPPKMNYLAIRPLDVAAKVNGSVQPVIFALNRDVQEGLYRLAEIPVMEGEIGFELSAYDRMRENGFNLGVHAAELYWDDTLLFSSRYDRFSFENTGKIELDRDFELRKKHGKMFYKLFLEEGNDLPIYERAGGRIGPGTAEPGPHQVEIRVFDAAGNSSALLFTVVFDRSPTILSCSYEKENGEQTIRVGYEDTDDGIAEVLVERSGLDEIGWEEIKQEKASGPLGELSVPLVRALDRPVLLRIRLKDGYGASSAPRYLAVNGEQLQRQEGQDSLKVEHKYDFRDSFFIFDLEFNQLLPDLPRFSLLAGGFAFDPVLSEQSDEKRCRAIFPFTFAQASEITLLIEAANLFGDELELVKKIPITIVTKSFGGAGVSPDGMARVNFGADVVYKDLSVMVQAEKMEFEAKHKLLGKAYSFEPSTVPLNGRARVSLRYPEGDCDPRKVGLYESTGEGGWRLVDQELDTLEMTVSGKVRHLSTFALLADTLPPKISKVSLRQGRRISAERPRITAVVKDDLSGIGNDEDILVEIDGEWMIPEYDPEKNVLLTRPVLPLAPGKHLLSIRVRDRAGNESRIIREFSVQRK